METLILLAPWEVPKCSLILIFSIAWVKWNVVSIEFASIWILRLQSPANATLSLNELFQIIFAFEDYSTQDAVKIKFLRAKPNQQTATISALQKKWNNLRWPLSLNYPSPLTLNKKILI